MKKVVFTVIASLLLVGFASGTASAHKVNVYAYAENGKVYTESYFSDGTKSINSRIEVFDSAGNRLLVGETDRGGDFSFPIPKIDDLKIVLNASMGHQAEYTLRKSEVETASPIKSGKTAAARKAESAKSLRMAVPPGKPAPACQDPEQLRKIVGEEVDVRVKPLYQMVADLRRAQEKPSLGEIIGGIGYIVGLMGIYLYARARR